MKMLDIITIMIKIMIITTAIINTIQAYSPTFIV